MRKSKLLIPILALITCLFVGASFATLNSNKAKAEDPTFVQLSLGDNTVTVTDNDISFGGIISMFTVETAGSYTFESEHFVVAVANADGSEILGTGTLTLAVGNYMIALSVENIDTVGDYIVTVTYNEPVVEPTVYQAGQMLKHETGIGNNTDSEFAF